MTEVFDPSSLGLEVAKPMGDEVLCRCPFHSDETPSATFNLIKGLFYCFGCGETRSAKALAKELGGSIVKVDIAVVRRSSYSDELFDASMLLAPLALDNDYLQSRQVTNDQVRKYGIRKVKNAIAFPILSQDDQLLGFQLRNLELGRKYLTLCEASVPWPLQDLKSTRANDTIYVTEGIFGVLRLQQFGCKAIALLGSQKTGLTMKYLLGRKIVGVFDNDLAGYVAAAKFISYQFEVVWPPLEADAINQAEWEARKTTDDLLTLTANLDNFQCSKIFAALRGKSHDKRVSF